MGYIQQLSNLIKQAKARQAVSSNKPTCIGKVIDTSTILVNGRYMSPTWAGDFYVKPGDSVICILDGPICLVLSRN